MAKTNKKHFDIFQKECEKWINIYGLSDWQIEICHVVYSDISKGACESDVVSRQATIYLDEDWQHAKITNETLKQVAFHEITELMIAELRSCAFSRFISEDEIISANHKIVRTLENVLFPKY